MVMAEEINPMGRTRLGPKIDNNNHPPTLNQNGNRKQRKRKRLSAILDTLHGQNNNVINYTNNNYNNNIYDVNQYRIKCEPPDSEVTNTELCIANAESLVQTNAETGQYIPSTQLSQFTYSPELSTTETTRTVLNLLKSSQIKNENTLVYALPTPPQEFPLDLSMKSNNKYYSLPNTQFNVVRQVSIVKDDHQTKDSMSTHFNLNVSPVVEEMPHGSNLAYVCPVCGQMFSVFDRLSKHVASRHKQKTASSDTVKSYVCDVCNRSFSRSDMLTRHFRLHSGNKPYSCKSCGQLFSRSDHLSTHQRTHTGEKPYRCSVCSYSACRRDMISRHMKTHLRKENLKNCQTIDQKQIIQLNIPSQIDIQQNFKPNQEIRIKTELLADSITM